MLLTPLAASAVSDGLITRAKSFESGVNVKGELDSSYAGKTVSVLLVKKDADISSITINDVAYINDCKINDSGRYELSFSCREGFNPEECKVYARVGSENVTSSVITAVSRENVLELIDYSVNISQNLSVSIASVDVDNVFNVTDENIIEYIPVIAFYNDGGQLIKTEIGKKNNPKLETAVPVGTKTTTAYVWKNIATMLPLCTPAEKTVKDNLNVLIIGNSFSVDGTFYLENIAEAAGVDMNVAVIQHGGSRLSTVWNLREADSYTNGGTVVNKPYFSFQYVGGLSAYNVKLSYAFEQGVDWDYVLIQEWRPDAGSYESEWEPYITNLAKYIKEKCPDAQLGLQMTWAFELGKPMNGYYDGTREGQKNMWANSYSYNRRAAAEIGAYEWKDGETVSFGGVPVMIVPSGYAIQYARGLEFDGIKKFDTIWDTEKYDAAAHNFDELRKQDSTAALVAEASALLSEQDTGKIRLHRDGFHMSQAGRYLIGCVWFETLTGKSPVGNTFVPGEVQFDSDVSGTNYRTQESGTQWVHYNAMSAEDAALLQNVAHEAVTRYNQGQIIE